MKELEGMLAAMPETARSKIAGLNVAQLYKID